MIHGESIIFTREPKEKKEQDEARNDMTAEVKERVMEQVAEGYDDQHATERDERIARAQTEDDERARDELNKWNKHADDPERPNRQKRVGEGQKIFLRMLERSELENFHYAGHEKDETEDQSCKE